MTLQQACQARYPEFEQGLSHALTVLTVWDKPLDVNREVASASSRDSAYSIAPEDRESWERWAEARLKEVERYIDLADEAHASGIKSDLSSMATEFVTFHGHARMGKLDRMIATLRRIDDNAHRVCTP